MGRFSDLTPAVTKDWRRELYDKPTRQPRLKKGLGKRTAITGSQNSPRTQKKSMSEPRTELDYEIERLKAEIQQERQMK